MNKSNHQFMRIALVYLSGLLLGGLYVGIIAPVRTVIQADMGIESDVGIWMINIYTLFYAALIPISGNIADRWGSKPVFTACLGLFSIGALLCGLSQFFGSFGMLLTGRVIQAAGAGGVMPVANAAIATAAPEGKRGMWLGIASAVAGVSNVIGAAVGSTICYIVGVNGWCWAFFVAVPIGLALLVLAVKWLPQDHKSPNKPIDVAGSLAFMLFVFCLLLGLKELSFTDLIGSIAQPMAFIPLTVAVVLLPAFYHLEKRAQDPVFHLEYLHSTRIMVIMAISFFVGCSIISMTLVPEFAEYALGVQVGVGGYFMAIIGIFAIAGPPMGGKMIDKFDAKPVLAGGLTVTCIGYLFLAFVVTPNPSIPIMIAGLAVVGLGMGFTMGAPLNYMILQNTVKEQSSSAIATVSLVRQMGTTLAPAILVGYITAGLGITGYCYMLIAVAVFNGISLILLAFYRQ